jgi:DUF917 family protein
MRWIYPESLEDIALGAAVLGTGGGGDPYIGKLMAQHVMRAYGPVQIIDVDELEDEDLVVPTAMMGAPTVMIEKLPRGDEIVEAFKALEAYLDRQVKAVMCIEAGGLNSTTPFTVASRLGLPLIDGDAMGRAFPEIQMVTLTLHGISATPMTLADDKGNSVLLNTIDNRWTERFARSITIDMGGASMIALYPMTGAQAKRAVVRGTISLIERIGQSIRRAHKEKRDPVEAVLRVTGGFRVFRGKIIDVVRRTEGGFARGEATLAGIDEDRGHLLKIHFQNEHLVAIRDDEVLVSVPDLITLLDAETGEPITTEAMRYGMRVVTVGIPCADPWRTPEGLELVGPKYFGYDIEYVPVEKRFGEQV